MSEFNASTPVGEWVAHQPCVASVFEELQVDYCCGGDRSLAEACAAKGISTEDVVNRLNAAIDLAGDTTQQDWTSASPSDLCDHIESTHHSFLRAELPRLTQLVNKVAEVHGDTHPELNELRAVFAELRAELEPHMLKEEQILFPAIRLLEQTATRPPFPFGTVANPIHMMEHEHDNAGNALRQIRTLTAGYRIPDDACTTWRVMLAGLANLETDLHQHIHKENNILFPAAQQLEAHAPTA